ncbi:hypothetical protein ZIOFF_014818 [Zingiber officinale]|uniref:Uncharacterized protein n=1 Tax=Zingiber officinale TaxID=94328 RepID=A0A8J5HQH8_ZINOF|nr:hypothetical protein ZIOFF_014818 [Zingiber officinale]
MASRQMEAIQRKLELLNYPRCNAPSQSLLFAGVERYALLEWLFFRLLGDRSPFTQQNWQGDSMDRDEENTRIQHLAEIANFLGITCSVDIEAIQASVHLFVGSKPDKSMDLSRMVDLWNFDFHLVALRSCYFALFQGKGSYEERVEMLHLIVDLVEASQYADNPEWSVDEQLAKDVQLVDSIAEKQAQIFAEELKLFPADVQIQSVYPLPDISELELKLSEHSNKLLNLQQMVQELASKFVIGGVNQYDYNPSEDYTEVELKLRSNLESFLETVKSFNLIYTKEIRPWTHMMEVPQLHGFGPASNRLLEAYNTLLKFLGNLRSVRESYAAMSIGSVSTTEEPSSITKIILDCESALTVHLFVGSKPDKSMDLSRMVDLWNFDGKGSYEERVEMLHLIVDLVEASQYADNPEWSVDEQLAKDVQLVDSIAEKQAQIFAEELKLFPADVQIQSVYPLPDISELELKLSEHSNKLLNLQQMVQELASKVLESVLSTIKSSGGSETSSYTSKISAISS